MKLSNKLFIKVELILIMLFIVGNAVLKLIPDKSNYGLAAVFSIEFLITIIAAFFTFFVYSAIIIVLLITIIYNIEQVYNRKDINKPIRYALILSLIMIEVALILIFWPYILPIL